MNFIIVENQIKVIQKGINTLKMALEMKDILKGQNLLNDYQIFQEVTK